MLASVHSAQFYMQNDSLLEMVSRFLKTGIASQTACIVIATRDHREGIAQRLQEHGFDLERAFENGIYIALDAETTLSHILVNGSPDPERFVHTIEPLLKRVTPGSVRIFGEMTTLLWMQGKREEAIALEELWNILLNRTSSIKLLCPYPLQSSTEDHDSRQFLHLCHQHAHVIPAESYTLLSNPQERLQTIVFLQQKAIALENEIVKNSTYTHLVEELLHLLATLKTTNEQLEQASTTFHHFIAKMGHEFRTGLTSIQGFSELLSTQEWGQEEIKEFASDIMTDAQRLTRLISDVLDLERMKLGKVELHWEMVDMNALLQRLSTQMQHTTTKHTLRCHLDEQLPLVPGDQDKLIQVVSNLLSNAVKYSPNGGEILLSSQRKQEMLQISIQDQGIGIPVKAQENVFRPYNRIGSEKTRYIQGIGLGLSVVREIISLHGGTIWVKSTPEHGSTFYFTLPLTQNHSTTIT